MAFARTIFCYFLGCLPILIWFLVCKYLKDYGLLLAIEILVVHILVPIIVRGVSNKFYKYQGNKYYEVTIKNSEAEIGIVVVVFIIGICILSFINSSKSWNYAEKT